MKPKTARQFAKIQPEQTHFSVRLSPLLQNIRNKKIHSYFQIKDQLENIDNDPTFQTLNIFNPQISKPIQKQLSPMHTTMYVKRTRQLSDSHQIPNKNNKNMQTTLKSFHTRNNPQFKHQSTIKKHLISQIDFDEIEKKLFKKPENITMYEVFCSKMRQKNNENRRMKTPSLVKPKVIPMLLNESQGNSYFDAKVKPKKRFWVRSQTRRQKIENTVKRFEILSELQISPNRLTNIKILSRRRNNQKA